MPSADVILKRWSTEHLSTSRTEDFDSKQSGIGLVMIADIMKVADGLALMIPLATMPITFQCLHFRR